MKKFLATAVFCLALVPTGAHTSYTIFPDGTLMTGARIYVLSAAPLALCVNKFAEWFLSYTLAVNDLSTLSPVHIRVEAICNGGGGSFSAPVSGYLYDLYGTSPPTITAENATYVLVWQVQSNVTGTWSPAGTFRLVIPYADIH
jgi:hypothetical protein